MNLLIKSAIKIADRKVIMFHLPGHGVPVIKFLNVSEVPNGSTARGKKVNIFQVAVKMVNKQSNNSPFFVIKDGCECVDACPHSRTSVSFPNDFALKWANHISSIV